MGGDSAANTCQQALTSGDPIQGCLLSGRGFTAALVAIDKDVFSDPVLSLSRPLGGQIWCKRSQRFQHQYLIKTEQMDFEGHHSFMFGRFAGSFGSRLWFFSRFPLLLTV